MPPVEQECKRFHCGDYAVCTDGTVWSFKSGEWEQKSTWLEHGHETVELYRFGERTRRRVATLLEEAFGDTEDDEDEDLRRYLKSEYGLTNDEVEDILSEGSDE
jgi:hypothetical protein